MKIFKLPELTNIKKSYYKYIETKNKKFIDDIMFIFLSQGASSYFLEIIYNSIIDNMFFNMIQFLFFYNGYNFDTEKRITSLELISISVLLIEYDENDKVINKKHDELDKFFVYKNKFLK